MSKKYITTTLPYVNADPHIGYALEVIRADIWTRWQRMQGNNVFFNLGVDEHGLKIYQRAQELGLETQVYCDQQAVKWQELGQTLNLSEHNFIRTTDKHHIEAVQEFWRQAKDNGFIYKKIYQAKYCVGCELEKTESELIDGYCPLHPNQKLQILEEENYFFKFSEFQEKLLRLYEERPAFVVPAHRFNEIKSFVKSGLQDFSVSRLKAKMPWGIEVPDDSEHVIYVWFDALINYVSAVGWPLSVKATEGEPATFFDWWPAIQVAGKDNLRQQSAMWQAMLTAVNLPPSRQIFINSFLTSNGQKMSKSLGNVIAPEELTAKFGTDGTRYLLASFNTFGDDMDVTLAGLMAKYNADLANGLGNLVSRVFKLASDYSSTEPRSGGASGEVLDFARTINDSMEAMKLFEALQLIREKIVWANQRIDETKIWDLVKTSKSEAQKILTELLGIIVAIGEALAPFMPETSEKILTAAKAEKIQKGERLFPRI
ncbi:MAG: Methionyl-tRNA synthetase [Parcubacteria group bacterium GW2011_GWA2_43_9b]|uniref:Methionine--tRNA ligase n=1 Tax=Candidatus Portnoybacteria bacterium RIFCSPLOWO2_02_FULL_39_11 TaxID=1802001 RepID=A0A1G2FNL1_9BACT|nr:MAG: Methionyl-tRNA synthetase [Parcubacteria group bacterium GW2011_GWA2_43_9b]OGZ39664.1 MAG: methionine--tRNA ligase [Candidatus Portnoybacteria bacterium RIFCSPLOWO2_02_FULL_39_11]